MAGQTCTICDWPEEETLAISAEAKAFFVRKPARPGHIAVATRAHRPRLQDASSSEAAAVLALARDIAAAAEPVLGIEKFYLAAVGDVDPHFHVHLLPKAADDPKLGPFLFSAVGWQGHDGLQHDPVVEKRIREAFNHRHPG
jgi:diadenosine tetraphosphate (Ap4A) HIT family hydrolase